MNCHLFPDVPFAEGCVVTLSGHDNERYLLGFRAPGQAIVVSATLTAAELLELEALLISARMERERAARIACAEVIGA